ncbi:uncharacterized protein CBL_01127 [Carabus blaptoides fortunei]
MATYVLVNIVKQELCKIHIKPLLQRGLSANKVIYNKTQTGQPKSAASAPATNVNVPGLSKAVHTTDEPVGPGASKSGEYKVPEYFNYNKNSYFEAEVEMNKYRLPQPSSLKK